MRNINAIIVDDELNSIHNLAMAIKEYAKTITVIGTSQTIVDGVKLWREHKPDLIFLDIEMHSGTGFDVYELAEGLGGKVVFYTAHKKYAIKALKMGALDYLLKPLDIDDLLSLEMRLAEEELDSNASVKGDRDKIAFPIANGYRYLHSNEIIAVKADRSYSEVHLVNDVLVISKNIGIVEEMLKGFEFYRCHKTYIINLSKVVEFSRKDGGFVLLTNSMEVPVSKEKKKGLLLKLNIK